MASTALVSQVVVSKFAWYLPLYRQVQRAAIRLLLDIPDDAGTRDDQHQRKSNGDPKPGLGKHTQIILHANDSITRSMRGAQCD